MYFNIWAVLISAFFGTLLGAFWYAPFAFGKSWMKESGMKKIKFSTGQYIGGFISKFITVIILAIILAIIGIESYYDSVIMAILVWLGFSGSIKLGGVIWKGKSISVYLINTTYDLLFFIISALVITFFG